MAKVSIVLPTYNSGSYIEETIDSILKQDYDDFEIVIVDDASTDDTRNIIHKINSEKIKYHCLENNHGGPSKPRNIGIEKSNGDYIVFFDSDDLMLKDRISSAVDVLESNPDIHLSFSDIIKFKNSYDDSGRRFLDEYRELSKLKTNLVGPECYEIFNADAYRSLFYENYIPTSTVTVRKKVFEEIGGFDESLTNSDDLDMWFRISNVYNIVYIDKATVGYRVREGSISTRGAKLSLNRAKTYIKQQGISKNTELEKQIKIQLSEIYAGLGYANRTFGNIDESRKYYLLSLKNKFDSRIFIKYLITFIGVNNINFLLKVKKYLVD